MYKELVERLRKCFDKGVYLPSDILQAADAIETLESELNRLKRERDQAVEELHRNTDAVPVVRCKDCKHSFERSGRKPFGCYLHGKNGITLHDGDDFCSYGERKEN